MTTDENERIACTETKINILENEVKGIRQTIRDGQEEIKCDIKELTLTLKAYIQESQRNTDMRVSKLEDWQCDIEDAVTELKVASAVTVKLTSQLEDARKDMLRVGTAILTGAVAIIFTYIWHKVTS